MLFDHPLCRIHLQLLDTMSCAVITIWLQVLAAMAQRRKECHSACYTLYMQPTTQEVTTIITC